MLALIALRFERQIRCHVVHSVSAEYLRRNYSNKHIFAKLIRTQIKLARVAHEKLRLGPIYIISGRILYLLAAP